MSNTSVDKSRGEACGARPLGADCNKGMQDMAKQ